MNIDEQRAARAAELIDESEHELIVARALDALAELIAAAEIPVRQYGPIWARVENRLQRDAREARARARRAAERIDDVRASIEAHQRYMERSET